MAPKTLRTSEDHYAIVGTAKVLEQILTERDELKELLAEAVQILEPFIDVLGEDSDGDIPDNTAVTIKCHRVTHYALKAGNLRAASAFAAKHGGWDG